MLSIHYRLNAVESCCVVAYYVCSSPGVLAFVLYDNILAVEQVLTQVWLMAVNIVSIYLITDGKGSVTGHNLDNLENRLKMCFGT